MNTGCKQLGRLLIPVRLSPPLPSVTLGESGYRKGWLMVLNAAPESEKNSTRVRNLHGHRYTSRRIFAFWYAIHRLAGV